jgi:hypothetical protein
MTMRKKMEQGNRNGKKMRKKPRETLRVEIDGVMP